MHPPRLVAPRFTTIAPILLATLAAPGIASAANTPPKVNGKPPTAVELGNYYFFRARATDANRDRLRFSIQNKPLWATF